MGPQMTRYLDRDIVVEIPGGTSLRVGWAVKGGT
jgi:hypothetical protein